MPKAAPKKKAANGYKLAEPLPLGETLQDISKKQWKLGASIGQGGFGAIYSAKEATDNSTKYPYVIKIEPHSNGPLFVEMHFYMRNSKKEDVEDFKKKMGLRMLGMPLYLGSGSHEYHEEKYRFIVMEKFGTDLWKLFLENNKVFPVSTVFKIAIQMLDVLEYIHGRGYVHADLKGANILMGVTKETLNKQLYLVDFGLATKFNNEPTFKPNPKKAHDGTIEYLSRDAHQGVQTRRGDLEILAYNIIQWLGCVLPWEKNLKDPNNVFKSKETFMSDLSKFMKICFIKKPPPAALEEFLNYLVSLKHNTKPDYKKIKKMFLRELGPDDALDKPFKFSGSAISKKSVSSPKRKVSKKKAAAESLESDVDGYDDTLLKNTPVKRNSKNISADNRKSPRRKAVPESSPDDVDEVDSSTDYSPAEKTPIKRKVNDVSSAGRKSRRKAVLEKSGDDMDVDDVIDFPATKNEEASEIDVDIADSLPMRSTVKRRHKNILSSKSKRKPRKKEPVSESSEDEKENDMDVDVEQNGLDASGSREEVMIKSRSRRKPMNRKKNSKTETSISKSLKEPSSSDNGSNNLNGYTEAMREVLKKKLDKEKGKKKTNDASEEASPDDLSGYNDTMKEMVLKKQQRLARTGTKKQD